LEPLLVRSMNMPALRAFINQAFVFFSIPTLSVLDHSLCAFDTIWFLRDSYIHFAAFNIHVFCSLEGQFKNMIRKNFLRNLLPLPFLGNGSIRAEKKLKIFIKSAWGSDDPTKASFPFLHGNALAEAGHEVQIFLLGEGVSLMRDSTLNAITPVGWPPLKEILPKVLANKIQIYACGACCKARGIVAADLENKNAKFGNPQIFVGLTEWCDKIITE
jgi:predicted peroxiredoxin